MYKLVLLLSLCLSLPAFGQSLTDAEAVKMAVEAKKSGSSDSEIASLLMKKGATAAQIQRIRSQYAKQATQRGLDNTGDNALGDAKARMRVNNEVTDNEIVTHESALAPDYEPGPLSPSGKRVFGRDIFNNKNLSFEPVMNIATPQNYVLGPGDQLIVDIYGASQESITLTVSPDGDVTIPEFGPVHVSGLTVASAQKRIRGKIGGYYEDSNIKASLGQTRTITVNVMGEVKVPGTYTLSSFATVFHALYKAGGINSLGTLRNIKVTKPPPISTTPPLPRKVRFESVVLLAFAAAAPPSANVILVAWQPESFRLMAFPILLTSTPAALAALRAWSKFTPAAPMKFL